MSKSSPAFQARLARGLNTGVRPRKTMSEKAAVWVQCHESVVGQLYAEVVRHDGVIQRQTQSGQLCSVLVRLPQASEAAFEEAANKIHGSVFITPA